MTQSVSQVTKIILALLALLLFIHFYTGSIFDFTTHQIDKIFNLEDRDSTSQSIISQTLSLAQESQKIANELGSVMQNNQDNCLHRIDMFSKEMFETNNIKFTSQGQTTRIEVLPRSGGTLLTSSEIGRGVRLCALHEIEQVEQLQDIILGATQVQSGLQGLTAPQTVSTIELGLHDNRNFIHNTIRRINNRLDDMSERLHVHFLMNTSSSDPIRIKNIEENKHLYFLKIDNNLCLIPVESRTGIIRGTNCRTNEGMLTANCVDGARSPPLRLERIYEDIESVQCEI